MHLIVVRHGTTDNNVKKLINGRNNIDLNGQGLKDAGMVSLVLKDVKFNKIYCSPLLRTKHTMEIINSNHYPVIYDERIIERDAGIMTNRPESHLDSTLWNKMDVGVIYGGSESFKDVIERVSLFLEELKEKHSNDTILVVTHSGVMRALEVLIFGYPGVERIKNWEYPNCCIKEYNL